MATIDRTTKDHSLQTRVASGINLILGAWLVISPWVYDYWTTEHDLAWNSVIAGVPIGIFAALRFRAPHAAAGLSWITALLGAWMVVSSWIFGFVADIDIVRNSFFVGAMVIALATWSAVATFVEHQHRPVWSE